MGKIGKDIGPNFLMVGFVVNLVPEAGINLEGYVLIAPVLHGLDGILWVLHK